LIRRRAPRRPPQLTARPHLARARDANDANATEHVTSARRFEARIERVVVCTRRGIADSFARNKRHIVAMDAAQLDECVARIAERRPDLTRFSNAEVCVKWDECLGEGGFCTAYRAEWNGASSPPSILSLVLPLAMARASRDRSSSSRSPRPARRR
jgi:hypothetical protein